MGVGGGGAWCGKEVVYGMYPCGLRSSESSMLLWKLGEPKSGVTLEAAGVVAVVMVVVAAVMPLVHALGGLGRNDSLSARFFT